jgi:predicted dehydrogenase
MTTATGTLGVAVVGLGIGEQHARTYLGLPDCSLRWLYDLDRERLERTARSLGHGTPAPAFATILADRAVDVVSIASYDEAHAEQASAALAAGKHVFVEKPLCRSAAELRAIRQAWQAAGHPHLASNLVLRAAPAFRWLRDAIAAGELGEVYAIDGDYLYGRIAKITQGWRKDVPDYSVMQGGGIHLVDLLLWLTGQRPASVTATGNRICTAATAFRYRDFAAATFDFPSGLIGRITANFGCVHHHQHVLRVFGTRATLVSDDAGVRLHRDREGARPDPLPLAAAPPGKGALIPEFVRAIVEGDDPRPAAEHELDVMAACVAAEVAVQTGQRVTVSRPGRTTEEAR